MFNDVQCHINYRIPIFWEINWHNREQIYILIAQKKMHVAPFFLQIVFKDPFFKLRFEPYGLP